jgi:cytochrome P450
MSDPDPELFDPFLPEFRVDPYPAYRRLREEAPVLRTPFDVWAVSRYRDVEAVVRDPRFGHAEGGDPATPGGPSGRPLGDRDVNLRSFLVMNPPDHTRLRGLVNQAFTARLVARLEPRIRALADRLLDEVAGAGDVELMSAFCFPLTLTVIRELIGVPAEAEKELREWSRVLTLVTEPPVMLSPDDHARIERASREFYAYIEALIGERRSRPADDLISRLVAVDEGGDRLTERELVQTCVLLVIAGHETSASMIGNAVLALMREPAQLASALSRPSLPETAADELLRYDPSVQITQRVVLEDGVTVGGRAIPRGDSVVLLLGAAGRDPEVFADPDRLDLNRASAARHLAFSGGIHFCLGAALARLELQVALEAILDRGEPRPAADPDWRTSLLLRGPERLPVHLG